MESQFPSLGVLCIRSIVNCVQNLQSLPCELKERILQEFVRQRTLSYEIAASLLHEDFTTLDVTGCLSFCQNQNINKALNLCSNIQSLILDDCFTITDAMIQNIKLCTNLQFLHLKRCWSLEKPPISISTLRTLNINDCNRISNETFMETLLECSNSLTDLRISGCKSLTLSNIRLISNCTCLTRLDVTKIQLGDSEFNDIITSCTSLTSLNISQCWDIHDESIELLGAIINTKLKNLDVSFCWHLTDASILSLAQNCKNLQTLMMSGCDRLTDACTENLAIKCPQLEFISFSGLHNITVDTCFHLSASNSLHKISLLRCFQINDIAVEALMSGDLSKIENLSFGGCNITDASVIRVCKKLHNLRSLSLAGCATITDASLEAVGNEVGLNLNVSGVPGVTSEGLIRMLTKCPRISGLNLNTCGFINDDIVKEISNSLHWLKNLNLSGCDKVTDIGCMYLTKGCTLLESLSIGGCSITVNIIMPLIKSCVYLNDLNLLGCDKRAVSTYLTKTPFLFQKVVYK